MFVLSIFIVSLTGSYVLCQDFLQSQFPLYGLSKVAAKRPLTLSSSCNSQLKNLYYAITKHEIWALRMLDSSGSPVNGFIWGNNYWLGTYSQCQWISSNKHTIISTSHPSSLSFPPFEVDFYISLFRQNTSFQTQSESGSQDMIHLGLCLPSSCSSEDLEPLLTLWSKQNLLTVQNLYNFSMEFQTVRLVQTNYSWIYSSFAITLTVIITAAILLTISGTIYDIYVWRPIRKKIIETQRSNNVRPSEIMKTINIQECSDLLNQDNNLNENYELKIDNSQHKSIPVHNIKPLEATGTPEYKQSIFAKLSVCFSVTSNMNKICPNFKEKNELSLIHGLRFFGMIWLIWLYSVFYLKYYAENKPLARRLSKGFTEQIISNSTFSVDTFFFASGFLLALKYYKTHRGSLKLDHNFSVKKKVNEFSLMVFKRFIRLTPVYIVVLVMVVISVKNIRQTSLFEIEEPSDEICLKYWWRNIAYINNLFKEDEMCMSWSWYLSTDMQFFLLGLFILILSTRFWKLASFAAAIIIVLSSFTTGYLSYGNLHIPSKLRPQLALLHVLHFSPWTRVGPYLIGMFTGYFVKHLKGELVIKRTTLITCWLMWSLCIIWALFGLYSKNMSLLSTALHAALSRTAWGFGLSWIVIACCTGNADAFKAVLSYPGWIPLSKLSYSAYLLSPLIINLIISNSETAMHLDFFQMIVFFFGHLGITYFCSFFFSLVLEIPLATLGKRAIELYTEDEKLRRVQISIQFLQFDQELRKYNFLKQLERIKQPEPRNVWASHNWLWARELCLLPDTFFQVSICQKL